MVFLLYLYCVIPNIISYLKIPFIFSVHIKKSLSRSPSLEKFEKTIKTMFFILPAMQEVKNSIPTLRNNPKVIENCIMFFCEALFRDFVRPFYKNENINNSVDEILDRILKDFFGENSLIVKYWFNAYNITWQRMMNFYQLKNDTGGLKDGKKSS